MTASPQAADALQDLAERYWQFQCHAYPMFAILAGETIDDGVLFRESPADFDASRATSTEMLTELERIDQAELGAQDRATHRLLHHELSRIRALHDVGAHLRPTLFPTGPAMSSTYFANTTSIQSKADAERYVERLKSIPAYLEDVRENLETQMMGVSADAGFAGKLNEFREHLGSGDFFAPSSEALREQIESLCKRIDGLLPAFFGHLPRITYGVRSIPEAIAERTPAAYAQPNPADRSAPGLMWVTSLPDRCPRSMHIPLVLHEAWPGHLMHIALMQEAEHLPSFRRHGAIRYPVCIEGWAIYCEGLGIEMGLYEAPEQHYGRLEMEMWRALRLVVDTGIHWLGWSREQAIETMARHMAMPRASIASEVDRYICWPGQALAYQIGNLEFRKMRKRAEEQLGDRFNPRDFHDQIIAAGPATIPVLNDLALDLSSTHPEADRAGTTTC